MQDGNVRTDMREFEDRHKYIVACTVLAHLTYPPFCHLKVAN